LYEIAVMNPRRSKRRAKKRKGNPSMKRNSKGRFVKRGRASNPRRKRRRHNPKAHKIRRRKRRAVAVSNPRRKRRRHNPRRHRARARRRNPRFGISRNDIVGQLMPAAVGGAGALLNSVLLGYVAPMLVPIAPFLTTGYGLHALRIGSSLGLGILGQKFGGRHGRQAGEGALTVAMYLLFRDVAVSFAPTLPLGDYEEISIDGTADQLGAYMDPATRLGAYMSGGRLPDGSRAAPGMGAYMSGNTSGVRTTLNYEGEADGFNLGGIDY
jgi:hypothetical protein